MMRRPPRSPLFPYTPLFRSLRAAAKNQTPRTEPMKPPPTRMVPSLRSSALRRKALRQLVVEEADRKSTRLNSSHANISYAVFCLKKKECETLQLILELVLQT